MEAGPTELDSTAARGVTRDENDGDRLRGTIAPSAVPIELVSAFAGDRDLSDDDQVRLNRLLETRGALFYSDLLYVISHHYFSPEIAKGIWEQILVHKVLMSDKLGRNVRVTVATLDYLSNITGEIRSLTLMTEAHIAQIVNLSMRDGMTGLFNHSTCYELLELELKNHRRYGVGVALIVFDLDDFKRVNDHYGHQEGDRILVALARTLTANTRDADICCRFGGEEFAAILPFTNDPREAFAIAERVRIGSAELACHEHRITVSAGIALCDGTISTAHALVEKADLALYRAKSEGKNRVVVSGGARPSL